MANSGKFGYVGRYGGSVTGGGGGSSGGSGTGGGGGQMEFHSVSNPGVENRHVYIHARHPVLATSNAPSCDAHQEVLPRLVFPRAGQWTAAITLSIKKNHTHKPRKQNVLPSAVRQNSYFLHNV